MSTTMFRCDHCNTTMTGSENYQQHIEGKKHLKKLKALSMGSSSVTQASTETGNGQSAQELVTVKGYGGQFVKPSSDTGNQGNKVDLPPPPKNVNAAQILGTNNADPVMNAVKANLLGKLPLKRQAYDGKCEVCDVEYTSASHEEQHLSGKKHKKKVQAKEVTGANAATLFCGFCNLHVNSVEQMDQHRSGTAHKKKVENAKKAQQETQPPHSAAKKKFVPSSGTEFSDQMLMPPLPPAALLDLKPLTYDK
ncbi:zinc finger protein 385B-like [Mercenaria mercenaria]|uniref:zinc finger protein 385B-like n=1 Tax=Mercenaria mercenaria TaxID=6596 RepID=UPI00234ECB8B|nr:zinc finger protein 385B-like [Mercenaria mercenaria]XP_045183071.2 zinc finger protein 385B-like [Mercenaria mercenaria]XP_053383014.1 zinc finger protein 385B-like [Mercenaria mercenaria]